MEWRRKENDILTFLYNRLQTFKTRLCDGLSGYYRRVINEFTYKNKKGGTSTILTINDSVSFLSLAWIVVVVVMPLRQNKPFLA
jgi:hypothetical protein